LNKIDASRVSTDRETLLLTITPVDYSLPKTELARSGDASQNEIGGFILPSWTREVQRQKSRGESDSANQIRHGDEAIGQLAEQAHMSGVYRKLVSRTSG